MQTIDYVIIKSADNAISASLQQRFISSYDDFFLNAFFACVLQSYDVFFFYRKACVIFYLLINNFYSDLFQFFYFNCLMCASTSLLYIALFAILLLYSYHLMAFNLSPFASYPSASQVIASMLEGWLFITVSSR